MDASIDEDQKGESVPIAERALKSGTGGGIETCKPDLQPRELIRSERRLSVRVPQDARLCC